MNDFTLTILMVLVFRAIVTLVGLAFCYLGYKLFVKGVYEKGGDLKAVWGDKNLALKQAGPGTFFAFFGVVVVGIGIWRDTGLTLTSGQQPPPSNTVGPAHVRHDENYKTLEQLVSQNGINVEKLGIYGYPLLWNIYLRCRYLGLSTDEVDKVFQQIVLPATKLDAEKKEPLNLSNSRFELFKHLDNLEPSKPITPPFMSGGKGGLGLE
jgi:hypothetical protein